MSFHEKLELWAKAIRRSAEEHGRPNSFWVRELAGEFGGLETSTGYYIGRKRLFDLWQALGGRDGWGSCPTYKNGRFFV